MKDLKLRQPPCDQCQAYCCRRHANKEFSVVLDRDEHERFRGIAVPASIYSADQTDRVIPYDNEGNCVLLSGRTCSVHEHKPRLCRKFSCVNLYICRSREHDDLLDECPDLLQLLEKGV
ncbi:MAG: hypothetical protein A2X45_03555 [Lentisphaerae bacterium GWF2_50_93]|nr:MAG: hypothetical protein A2X45_03555 [Lentisphaerae bacterium GWF2_50_93]